ncbi:MAG TPA: SDR family NAD(P)-dependent oxidoreductase [Anaeromyxobacteraceae bacterium]|nr:SDR family NAD(P)-dependent oxidoreductase [Anaeromyxobacteraceae bacterium]
MRSLKERYGSWALVAGASAGLGEAFARRLAREGISLVLLARRAGALERLAADLRASHRVEARPVAADLADPAILETTRAAVAGLEVGLLVYNAAHSAIGPFLKVPLEEQLRVLWVNCRGPLLLSHLLGSEMARRGRGGIVLMTSVAGSQGNPWLASYAASKAFNLVLAEGLWEELRGRGVDVVACRAGAIRTPGFLASRPKRRTPLMEPEPVVEAALAALGRGPSVVPGALNRLAAFAFARLLPRRTSIRVMGRATRRLYE